MKKKQTTALAKRPVVKKKAAPRPMLAKRKQAVRTAPKAAPQPPQQEIERVERTIGDEVIIGDFGIEEVTFTANEEAVLSRPFDVNELRVKPDSGGAVYIPHANLTRRCIEAFGRTGYHLVPASRPQIGQGTVVVPYRLFVHGKPVAFSYGEQDFHENNRNQSYGDAIEATQASGLRRCLKRLGVALELWDKEFTEAFLSEYCVKVPVRVKMRQRDGTDNEETRYQWRRKIDPPFWNEIKPGRHVTQDEHSQGPAPNKPVYSDGKGEEKITENQVDRLWTIARKRGRHEQELRDYLLTFGYNSTRDIKRKHYEDIISAIEHPGALSGTRREPGQEG